MMFRLVHLRITWMDNQLFHVVLEFVEFSRNSQKLHVNKKDISWKSDRDSKFGKNVRILFVPFESIIHVQALKMICFVCLFTKFLSISFLSEYSLSIMDEF
ncbi:unnamed protein product [Eruca vesicaria subsp. sativa]|uniref:Uncharacterized protein n=1 Tax=Eruca vesicaria subsp. sativa TaxID=29727 RepID=A0ABC8JN43_ERUVS|nr:unnamed protein product [Eruca vesicaria subsp. sativa]